MAAKRITRDTILALVSNANSNVKISVSWLTDEYLINQLTIAAKKIKLEIVLSNDILNAYRFGAIRQLQNAGATVMKIGAKTVGSGNFMHQKLMIVDQQKVYGGSFNFTTSASDNYENFDEYPAYKAQAYCQEFAELLSQSIDYKIEFENIKDIQALLEEQIKISKAFNENLQKQISQENRKYIMDATSDRLKVMESELKVQAQKNSIMTSAYNLQNGSTGISSQGTLSTENNTQVKKHSFHGGNASKVILQKIENAYAYSLLQKKEIEKTYSFFKCQIHNDTLICTGTVELKDCQPYKIRIEFQAGSKPRVTILNHEIVPHSAIHMYSDSSLCLFYPGEFKWRNTTSIAQYTIPWVFEWILCYELFLVTGKWHGEAVDHSVILPFRKPTENSRAA